jgi:hypothetical protein
MKPWHAGMRAAPGGYYRSDSTTASKGSFAFFQNPEKTMRSPCPYQKNSYLVGPPFGQSMQSKERGLDPLDGELSLRKGN